MRCAFFQLKSDRRGTVMVEYVVVLCLVSIGASVALIALGVPLLRMYLWHEAWLGLSVP